MKNTWLIWLFVIVVIVTIFAVFNHQSGQKQRSLAEIFPGNEEVIPVDVEYEFIDTDLQAVKTESKEDLKTNTPIPAVATATTDKPAVPKTAPGTSQTPEVPQVKVTAERVDVPKPASQESLPVYTIQIGSFKKESQAEDALTKLKNSGHNPFIVPRDLGDKGVWYRVYAGKFSTKADATAYLPKLQAVYKDAFVISPK